MGRLFWLLIAVGCLGAAPAWALSADQVLQLKKAGVSEAVIQKIIDTEMAQAGGPRLGRYVLRQSGGREVIVYQAQSGGGAREYPLEMDPAWHAGVGTKHQRHTLLASRIELPFEMLVPLDSWFSACYSSALCPLKSHAWEPVLARNR
ncbi:MAG: hypothetical protein HY794_05160, partial [Desulfarculus sp.]|nr:hypothetical protein [Desulfarculus sp.]